jgi:hypothetical protein
MPTTPAFALPYPPETNPADVPVDLQKLAVAVDAALGTMIPGTSRGVANGVAALDAGGTVPAAQLPSGVWVPLSAVGVANGVASLDAGGKIPASQLPLVGASYGIALPASPADGQEAILVDSLTVPTYQWRFRWNAGSTNADKWEFIGGIALSGGNGAAANAPGGGYAALANPVAVTLPRPGVYDLQYGGEGATGRAGNQLYLAPNGGGLAAADAQAATLGSSGGGDNPSGSVYTADHATVEASRSNVVLTAGVLALFGKLAPGAVSSGSWSNCFLRATPKRVS